MRLVLNVSWSSFDEMGRVAMKQDDEPRQAEEDLEVA